LDAQGSLKEAYLKGIGAGLSRDPRTIEIALLPDDCVIVTDLFAERVEPQWCARLLDPASGWVAAVAAPGHVQSTAMHDWPPREIAGAGD
jgi:phosphopantetheinyl transferase